MDAPSRGRVPPGVGCRDLLATGHQAEVCTLSGRGDRFIPYPDHYSRAFAFSALLCPPQYQRSSRTVLLSSTLPLRREENRRQHRDGVVTFRTSNRIVRVLPLRRRLLCQRIPTKQRYNQPHPILGRAIGIAPGRRRTSPSKLDDVSTAIRFR